MTLRVFLHCPLFQFFSKDMTVTTGKGLSGGSATGGTFTLTRLASVRFMGVTLASLSFHYLFPWGGKLSKRVTLISRFRASSSHFGATSSCQIVEVGAAGSRVLG